MYHADLGVLWGGRRFRLLLNLIDHLPATSLLAEAIADDDEQAELWLAVHPETPTAPDPPRLSTWTPEVELLTELADRVSELTQTVVAMGGGHPGAVRPLPRPETAVMRARRRRHREANQRLTARVLRPGSAEAAMRMLRKETQ